MTDTDPIRHEQVQQAHDYLRELGRFSMGMANVGMADVERQVLYSDDRAENDAEHSFHLGLSAVEMAANYYSQLDIGLVAQFANVHDLAEVYAGDVPSHNLTIEQRAEKEDNERLAVERLLFELPPYNADLLRRYEEQKEPEARFVRFIDKLLPSIIHSLKPDVNRAVLEREYGYKTADDLLKNREEGTAMLQRMFPEFGFIHEVRDALATTARKEMYGE